MKVRLPLLDPLSLPRPLLLFTTRMYPLNLIPGSRLTSSNGIRLVLTEWVSVSLLVFWTRVYSVHVSLRRPPSNTSKRNTDVDKRETLPFVSVINSYSYYPFSKPLTPSRPFYTSVVTPLTYTLTVSVHVDVTAHRGHTGTSNHQHLSHYDRSHRYTGRDRIQPSRCLIPLLIYICTISKRSSHFVLFSSSSELPYRFPV